MQVFCPLEIEAYIVLEFLSLGGILVMDNTENHSAREMLLNIGGGRVTASLFSFPAQNPDRKACVSL